MSKLHYAGKLITFSKEVVGRNLETLAMSGLAYKCRSWDYRTVSPKLYDVTQYKAVLTLSDVEESICLYELTEDALQKSLRELIDIAPADMPIAGKDVIVPGSFNFIFDNDGEPSQACHFSFFLRENEKKSDDIPLYEIYRRALHRAHDLGGRKGDGLNIAFHPQDLAALCVKINRLKASDFS